MPDPPSREGLGQTGFRRALVLGRDAERVAATVRLIASTGVAAEVEEAAVASPDEGSADLVVALGSARDEVRAVLPSLAPGGVLYWEVDGRPPSGRVLRGAGLTATTYWRRRHGDHDTLFLPLGPGGAARWYLDELVDARGSARRVVRRVAATSGPATRAGLRLLGRRWSCVAVRGGDDLTPAVLAATGPGRALPVVLTRGEGEWSRVVLLPFATGDGEPDRVVKVPRLARHGDATRHEQRLLAELAAALPPPLADAVPRALGASEWRGLPVAVESFVPGRPLGHDVRDRADAGADGLRAASAWLTALARVAPSGEVGPAGLDEVLEAAARRCGLDLSPEALRRFGSAALAGTDVTPVHEHGDLTPTNLRVHDGRLTAVDWEAGRVGWPLTDLLYLLLHWPWPGLGTAAPLGDAFAAAFLRRDGLASRVAREVVGTHLDVLGLPQHVVAPLLAHVLARQALDREDRRAASTDAPEGNLYADLLARLLASPEGAGWW